MAAGRYDVLSRQLSDGVPTFVYLHRPGDTWRAELRDVRRDRPADEANRIPPYYREQLASHHLWLKLAEFEQLDPSYPEEHLMLDGSTDPDSVAQAFRGQASLLYVRHRDEPSRDIPAKRSLWWINQGTTYRASRDGGFVWGPHVDKAGGRQPSWDRLMELEVGDAILHYANQQIRAVGRVRARAVEADRPDDFPDQDAWNREGLRVEVSIESWLSRSRSRRFRLSYERPARGRLRALDPCSRGIASASLTSSPPGLRTRFRSWS